MFGLFGKGWGGGNGCGCGNVRAGEEGMSWEERWLVWAGEEGWSVRAGEEGMVSKGWGGGQ